MTGSAPSSGSNARPSPRLSTEPGSRSPTPSARRVAGSPRSSGPGHPPRPVRRRGSGDCRGRRHHHRHRLRSACGRRPRAVVRRAAGTRGRSAGRRRRPRSPRGPDQQYKRGRPARQSCWRRRQPRFLGGGPRAARTVSGPELATYPRSAHAARRSARAAAGVVMERGSCRRPEGPPGSPDPHRQPSRPRRDPRPGIPSSPRRPPSQSANPTRTKSRRRL